MAQTPRFFSCAPESPEDQRLYGLSKALACFQDLNRSMTVETANVFLMVALNEGQKAVEYARDTGLSQSTMSRILIDLSEYRRDNSEEAETGRKQSYGLVVSNVDPMELRAKRYFLTKRGKWFRDRLLSAIGTQA